jgi:L-seryl-tRNA(Ser) seleniumtransferase
MQEKLRKIPALHHFLKDIWVAEFGHARVVFEARAYLNHLRSNVLNGAELPSVSQMDTALRQRLGGGIVPVINGTGVVLHTNLGRSPWSRTAQSAALGAMGYAAVEVDAASGKRGRRGGSVEDRLCALVDAPAALIVNNCAAAVLLALRTFAQNKSVVVSRGELVEIGGGYRVPEVLEESGAHLYEVGTTNRTHLHDYETAIEKIPKGSAVILKVHQSNFRQEGFVTQPDVKELVNLPAMLIVDLGSGAVHPRPDEPAISELLQQGAPVVCFSGDKLFGGPQAGIVVGHKDPIEAMRKSPLYRALRPDKVTLAGLSGTLDDWLCQRNLPVWEMVEHSADDLKTRVDTWVAALQELGDVSAVPVSGAVGGGSLPGVSWDSWALCIKGRPVNETKARLLACQPSIYGVIKDDSFLLDARTIVPFVENDDFVQMLRAALMKA